MKLWIYFRRRFTINRKYSVLLFDLGGVLIDCNEFTKLLEWQTWTEDKQELDRKWQESKAVREYRLGSISTKEFYDQITSEFALNVGVARFLKEFRLLPKGFYPGAQELLKKISRNYMTIALSNTNEVHWNKLCDVDSIEKYFTKCYPSHLIHKIKPDDSAFNYVLKALKTDPSNIAFFDDREENADTARKLGIDAFVTKGFEELCEKLSELSIL